jgi:hypothetical protein
LRAPGFFDCRGGTKGVRSIVGPSRELSVILQRLQALQRDEFQVGSLRQERRLLVRMIRAERIESVGLRIDVESVGTVGE